jgi:hypothetical protein
MQHQWSVNKQIISVQTTHTCCFTLRASFLSVIQQTTPSGSQTWKFNTIMSVCTTGHNPQPSKPPPNLTKSLCKNINLILPYSSWSCKWPLFKTFPIKFLYAFLISSLCPPQTHKILLCWQFWHCSCNALKTAERVQWASHHSRRNSSRCTTQVQYEASLCGICGGQSVNSTSSSPSTSLSPVTLSSPTPPYSIIYPCSHVIFTLDSIIKESSSVPTTVTILHWVWG